MIKKRYKSYCSKTLTGSVCVQGRRKGGGGVRTILRAHDGRGPPEGET